MGLARELRTVVTLKCPRHLLPTKQMRHSRKEWASLQCSTAPFGTRGPSGRAQQRATVHPCTRNAQPGRTVPHLRGRGPTGGGGVPHSHQTSMGSGAGLPRQEGDGARIQTPARAQWAPALRGALRGHHRNGLRQRRTRSGAGEGGRVAQGCAGKSSNATTQPKQQQIQGPGHVGLMATMWVPTGARIPIFSPNGHPSQGRQKGFRRSHILKTFRQAPKMVKTAKNNKSVRLQKW